jgi:uncharacterized UBP type Zn finger protein
MIANVTDATVVLSDGHREIRNNPFRSLLSGDILSIFNISAPSLMPRSLNGNDPDPSKVRALIDMGFEDDRARRVLFHFRNDLDLAMDYLIHTP